MGHDATRQLPPSGLTPVAAALIADLQDGQPSGGFRFVGSVHDLPGALGGVIQLEGRTTYLFVGTVDLEGARLVAGDSTVILGTSSENSRLKSTGLERKPLISSDYTLVIRFITIEADLALDLDPSRSGVTPTALDWNGVNFTDCGRVGRIANYGNVIFLNGALLNSGELVFDGAHGTIGIEGSLLQPPVGQVAVRVLASASVARRFRTIYSAAVIAPGAGGFDVAEAAIANDETFILDTVNFAGGGDYLPGIGSESNSALFTGCVGIVNTAVNGQIYMRGNAAATAIANTVDFFKVAGVTTPSPDNAKYEATDNRLTNRARVQRKYLIQATLSFNSGSNNQCYFGFYDSKIGAVRDPSTTLATANSGGRAESVTLMCVIQHSDGDFIEIHARNSSAANSITVTDMNVLITEIR